MNCIDIYKDCVDNLNPSEELISKLLERTEVKTMHFAKKKMLVFVAVACMLVGTTVFAAGKITGYRSWSSNLTTESDINISRDNAEKLGISLEIPEGFSTGYSFNNSNIGGTEGVDENGKAIAKGKSFMATYSKEGNPDVYLNVNPAFEPLTVEEGCSSIDVNGTLVYIHNDIYKFVPPDYELTEEDKENMEKPGYEISYGSDKVEVMKCDGFIFEYDSKIYNAISFDSSLTNDEWCQMAKELLAQ